MQQCCEQCYNWTQPIAAADDAVTALWISVHVRFFFLVNGVRSSASRVLYTGQGRSVPYARAHVRTCARASTLIYGNKNVVDFCDGSSPRWGFTACPLAPSCLLRCLRHLHDFNSTTSAYKNTDVLPREYYTFSYAYAPVGAHAYCGSYVCAMQQWRVC